MLVYSEESRNYLKILAINTFYFENSLEDINNHTNDFCIRSLPRWRWMSVIMELKIRFWLELCRNEKQFVIFDSDTLFHYNPDVLFFCSKFDFYQDY